MKQELNGKIGLFTEPDLSNNALATVLARRNEDGEIVRVAVGSGTGTVESVTGNVVDNTDPDNPVINIDLAAKADLVAGKVPASQLPSYVDDVIEVADFDSLPLTGETGKLYVTLDTELLYRWTGTLYVEISPSSVPNLQSVLNIGSQADINEVIALTASNGDDNFSQLILEPDGVAKLESLTAVELTKGDIQALLNDDGFGVRTNTGYGYFKSDNLGAVTPYTYQLPTANGTLVISVNGNAADVNGNITVATGGTVDAVPTDGSANAVSSNGTFDALAAKVSTTGNETVAGVKTFSSAPVMSAGEVISNGFSISNSISTILQLFFGDASNAARAQRNTADAIPAFITRNANSSSTGNIHNFESNISGTTIARAFVARNGDIEITTAGGGVILKSPSGTRYKITVSDAGVLTTTLA